MADTISTSFQALSHSFSQAQHYLIITHIHSADTTSSIQRHVQPELHTHQSQYQHQKTKEKSQDKAPPKAVPSLRSATNSSTELRYRPK